MQSSYIYLCTLMRITLYVLIHFTRSDKSVVLPSQQTASTAKPIVMAFKDKYPGHLPNLQYNLKTLHNYSQLHRPPTVCIIT